MNPRQGRWTVPTPLSRWIDAIVKVAGKQLDGKHKTGKNDAGRKMSYASDAMSEEDTTHDYDC